MLAFWGWIEKTVWMRGAPDPQLVMLTTLSTEDLIPADHPIRRIRAVVEVVLDELDGVFETMYSSGGRASVPPETLLKATIHTAPTGPRSNASSPTSCAAATAEDAPASADDQRSTPTSTSSLPQPT